MSGPSPAGPVRPPRLAGPLGARLRRSRRFPFCGFCGVWVGGWLAFPLVLAPSSPPAPSRTPAPAARAPRAPLPAAAAAAREAPSPPPPRALPGAPGGGRRSPSRSALLFWVLCVINVGPPHSNQAHYKFLRARGRKSCAPPRPFPHSFTSYLSRCFLTRRPRPLPRSRPSSPGFNPHPSSAVSVHPAPPPPRRLPPPLRTPFLLLSLPPSSAAARRPPPPLSRSLPLPGRGA